MNILESIIANNGIKFELWLSVWQHIQAAHPEIGSTESLKVVLQNPDFIVRSKWMSTSHLYYRKEGTYYKVVVVDVVQRRIKTAYTADQVKIGEIVWKKEQ